MPDADTECDTLKVTANGSYSASDAGKYGYDYVIVSVPGSSVTGRDPDTGEEVEVHTDPETGNIVTTKLPTRISINIYPNNLVYEDGQTIDFTGLRVKAFLPDGTEYGIVPDGELIKPVTVAEGDGESSNTFSVSYDATMLEDSYDINPLVFCKSCTYVNLADGQNPHILISVTASSGYFITFSQGYYFVSDRDATITETYDNGQVKTSSRDAMEVTIDNQKVMMAIYASTSGTLSFDNPTYPSWPSSYMLPDMYRLLYMGYGTRIGDDSQQTIPLQWKRPGDGKVLETSFTINVTGGNT